MGGESQFITFEVKKGGLVTFGDNDKEKIIGIGNIKITPFIENILPVNGLKYNLLSISQLCDEDFKVSFESSLCTVTSFIDNSIN